MSQNRQLKVLAFISWHKFHIVCVYVLDLLAYAKAVK